MEVYRFSYPRINQLVKQQLKDNVYRNNVTRPEYSFGKSSNKL